MRFRWDMWIWARLAAAAGSKRVYFYQFSRAPPFTPTSRYFGMGATHGMEMPYVFGHLDPALASWTAADLQLSNTVQSYWTQFAASGDPYAPAFPVWPGFRSSPDQVMMLNQRPRESPLPNAGALRRINRLYWLVRTGAGRPIATLALTSAVVMAVLAGLVLAYRRWRHRHRHGKLHARCLSARYKAQAAPRYYQ